MKQRILYTLAILFATMQTFAQNTVKYEYDALNRLTQVTYSNGVTIAYSYDELGNRLSKNVTGVPLITKGDANGDGKVDAADILDIVNYMMGKATSTGKFYERVADMNGDNVVNAADIIIIVNTILSK